MTIQGYITEGFQAVMRSLADGFGSQRNCCRAMADRLKAIEKKQDAQILQLDQIQQTQQRIIDALIPGSTVSAAFAFFGLGANMTVKDTQKITFSIKPVDAKGNPSNIDPTKTTLSASDATLATVAVNADGLTGTVTLSGPLGTFTINGSIADDPTDGSDGGTIVIQSEAITIVGGDTATATIALAVS